MLLIRTIAFGYSDNFHTEFALGLHCGLRQIQGFVRVNLSPFVVVQSNSAIFGSLKFNWRQIATGLEQASI